MTSSSNDFKNYFILVTVAKMAVDDASKLSGNGGFGGNDGKN